MTDQEAPSKRLVEQRLRNRIMEEILTISEGDAGVREAGPTEYFMSFFDWFPYEGEPTLYPAMQVQEIKAVREVCRLMQQALSEIDLSGEISTEDVIRTGWPRRIAPVAQHALNIMIERGRFSEEEEEDIPSAPIPWP